VPPVVAHLDRRRLADVVADELLEAINTGRFAPGQQLPSEPDLARQLGVGRTSLREAIQRLRTLGVVEVRKGLGTFVVAGGPTDPILSFAAWSAENGYEVANLLEARIALEVAAAPLAAQRATKREIAALRAAGTAHLRAERRGSMDELVATDRDFHVALVAAGGNGLLAQLYGMLVPQLSEYRRVSLAIPGAPARSSGGHMAIVDAIAARDPRGARAAVLAHLSVLYGELVEAAGAQGRRRRSVDWAAFDADADADAD
jgi:GntR family transcriptional repressor for pyruvate dehydrogenase complex